MVFGDSGRGFGRWAFAVFGFEIGIDRLAGFETDRLSGFVVFWTGFGRLMLVAGGDCRRVMAFWSSINQSKQYPESRVRGRGFRLK